VRHALLTLLAACSGADNDCPAGSALQADGLCHLVDGGADDTAAPNDDTAGTDDSGDTDDSGETDDTDDTDNTDDTAEPGDWLTLPNSCTPPSTVALDPMLEIGAVNVQDYVFAELIDVDLDEDASVIWGAGQGGIVSVDVSNPTQPSFLAAASPFDWFQRAYQIHVGPYPAVYASHRDYGVAAYDRSNATRPELGTIIELPDASGMGSDGDYLYVATHSGTLVTYDVSTDPLDPQEGATLTGLGNAWRMTLTSDRIYMADNTLGVVVIDRSAAATPSLVGNVDAAGGAQDLSLSEDATTLYVAVGGAGIEVFSLDDPDIPASIDVLDLHTSVISVDVDGDTLWATTQQDVVAIDISTPGSPFVVNTEETTQWAMSVDAHDGKAYVGDWAFLSSYVVDTAIFAPDLDLSSSQVHMSADEPDTATITVANLGSAPLNLSGATVSDSSLTVDFDQVVIPAGGTGTMRVRGTGDGALDAEVCLASDDPDEPGHTVEISSGGTGGTALGVEAPEFALTGLDGVEYRLSEQRGHPVVLVYFATW
jgi:hypothetical protein